jgi:RHS repeat-associated protein
LALSDPREGCYYIYSFDGRLLAEYDIYGECLKDYIYMGARLVAEFKPVTSQYFYYTQDQIGSTRVVTNDAGAVVYAEAHDPYGGIQKTWVNNFEPKRKFSDKERDEETGLDYFGARYYASTKYRWLSVDRVLNVDRSVANPQTWNLYSFCENNPTTYSDPKGDSLAPSIPLLLPLKLLDAAFRAQLSLSNLFRGISWDFKVTDYLDETNWKGGLSDWTGISGVVPHIIKIKNTWVIRFEYKVGFRLRILTEGHKWYSAYGTSYEKVLKHEMSHMLSHLVCINYIREQADLLERIEFPAKFLAETAAFTFKTYARSLVSIEHYALNLGAFHIFGIRPW